MVQWARELLDSMQGLCELLDHGEPSRPYQAALEQQRAKIDEVERTPSARLLAEMRRAARPFSSSRSACPACTRIIFSICIRPTRAGWPSSRRPRKHSLEEQARIEASDKVDFDTYLAQYLAE